MKKAFCVALLLGGLIRAGQSQDLHIAAPAILRYDDWELVYEDDFNYDTASRGVPARWNTQFYASDTSLFADAIPNRDRQGNRYSNVEWYDGTNTMAMHREATPAGTNTILRITAASLGPDSCFIGAGPQVPEATDTLAVSKYTYKSGLLVSQESHQDNKQTTGSRRGFLYGMFEIRCKIPLGDGITPAFWLNGVNAWPPEVDVFETNSTDKSIMYSSVHWPVPEGRRHCAVHFQADYPNFFALDYHTWTCVWTPTTITFYVDGRELYSITSPYRNDATFNAVDLIANLGVHSNATRAQARFDIDYIRVFKPRRAIKLLSQSDPGPPELVADVAAAASLRADSAMSQLFYLNTAGGVSTMTALPHSDRWVHATLPQDVPDATGELLWHERRQALFYINTARGISCFSRGRGNTPTAWQHEPLLAGGGPGDAAGGLAANAAGDRLYYRNTSGGISSLAYSPANGWISERTPFPGAPNNVTGKLLWSEKRQALFYQDTLHRIFHVRRDTLAKPNAPQWAWGPLITKGPAPANVAGELEWSERRNALFYKDTDTRISHAYLDTWTHKNRWQWKAARVGFDAPADMNMYRRMTAEPGSWYTDSTLVTGGMKWSDAENSLFFTGPKKKLYRLFWQNRKWNIQVIKWRGADRDGFRDELFSETEVAAGSNLELLGQFGPGRAGRFVCYKTADTTSIGIAHWVNPVNLDPTCNNRGEGPKVAIHIGGCLTCDQRAYASTKVPEAAPLHTVSVLSFSSQPVQRYEHISKSDLDKALSRLPAGFYVVQYAYQDRWVTSKYHKAP